MEVKHGEWIDDGFGRGNMICSLCKQYPVDDEDGNPLSVLIDWQPEFCPKCGAKMDVSKKEITTGRGADNGNSKTSD